MGTQNRSAKGFVGFDHLLHHLLRGWDDLLIIGVQINKDFGLTIRYSGYVGTPVGLSGSREGELRGDSCTH
jgi:hypothetical protein